MLYNVIDKIVWNIDKSKNGVVDNFSFVLHIVCYLPEPNREDSSTSPTLRYLLCVTFPKL